MHTPPNHDAPILKRPTMYYGDPSGCHTKDPAVVRHGGAYWMYYSQCWKQGWQIAIARSADLVNWQYEGTLNELKASGTRTREQMAAPGARVINGRVELFYQDYRPGHLSRIYHVYSQDGKTFEGGRDEPAVAPIGAWNCGRAIDADVLVRGEDLLMYWATRDPDMSIQMQGVSSAALGCDYADPANWRQLNAEGPVLCPRQPTALDVDHGLCPEALAWEGACIEAAATMLWDNRVLMFYGGGYNNAPQQIGFAMSDDGLRFRRLNEGAPVLPVGATDAWNGGESGHPFVFTDDDGESYLFYQGDNPSLGYNWRISMLPLRVERGRDALPVVRLG